MQTTANNAYVKQRNSKLLSQKYENGAYKKFVTNTVNHMICASYFVTFQQRLLQLKRTWFRISSKLGYRCKITVDLALLASHLPCR